MYAAIHPKEVAAASIAIKAANYTGSVIDEEAVEKLNRILTPLDGLTNNPVRMSIRQTPPIISPDGGGWNAFNIKHLGHSLTLGDFAQYAYSGGGYAKPPGEIVALSNHVRESPGGELARYMDPSIQCARDVNSYKFGSINPPDMDTIREILRTIDGARYKHIDVGAVLKRLNTLTKRFSTVGKRFQIGYMVQYNVAAATKDEGNDFYALILEHQKRLSGCFRIQGVGTRPCKVEAWSSIYGGSNEKYCPPFPSDVPKHPEYETEPMNASCTMACDNANLNFSKPEDYAKILYACQEVSIMEAFGDLIGPTTNLSSLPLIMFLAVATGTIALCMTIGGRKSNTRSKLDKQKVT
jgi:hypothetical protein